MANHFAKLDAKNSQYYASNAAQVISELRALNTNINHILHQYKSRPFIVYHDGYQYFEQEYGLQNIGSIVSGHHIVWGPKTMQRLKHVIKAQDIKCILIEANTPRHVLDSLKKITNLNTAEVNIEFSLGTDYFKMMQQNAEMIKNCLS